MPGSGFAARCSMRCASLTGTAIGAPQGPAAAQALREVEALRGAEANEADVAAHMGVSLAEYQRIVQDTLGCQLLRLNDADGEDSALDRLPDGAPDPEAARSMIRCARRSSTRSRCCPSGTPGAVAVLRAGAESQGDRAVLQVTDHASASCMARRCCGLSRSSPSGTARAVSWTY